LKVTGKGCGKRYKEGTYGQNTEYNHYGHFFLSVLAATLFRMFLRLELVFERLFSPGQKIVTKGNLKRRQQRE
jgi:hypothetical protein